MSNVDFYDLLLAQMKMKPKEEQPYPLSTGYLEPLQVSEKSSCWRFYLHCETLLSVMQYEDLYQRMCQSFPFVEKIELHIKPEKIEDIDSFLGQYWHKVGQELIQQSPMMRHYMQQVQTKIEGTHITLQFANVQAKNYLEEHYTHWLQEQFSLYGFPKLTFHFQLWSEDHTEEEYLATTQKIQAEEEQIRKQLSEVLQQKEEEKIEVAKGPVQIGYKWNEKKWTHPIPLKEITEEGDLVVQGAIFRIELDKRERGSLLKLYITDYQSSLMLKKFLTKEEEKQVERLEKGMWIQAFGPVRADRFENDDLTMQWRSIREIPHTVREEKVTEPYEKRVELHAHTHMSMLDGVASVSKIISTAARFGHEAVAITDHAVAQGYPEAYAAGKKHNIKVLYGTEAYMVEETVPIAYNEAPVPLREAEYVVFDVETTSLSPAYGKIIELAGVKMYKGNIVDQFDEFIDPGHPLSETTTALTGITDAMVKGSKTEKEVLEAFHEFCGDCILVAHNATFDISYLNNARRRYDWDEVQNPIIDTLELARLLHPEYKRFNLGTLCKKNDILLENAHRAIYDAEATGHLAWIYVRESEEKLQITKHDEFNAHIPKESGHDKPFPNHVTLLVQTQAGLKNLFKMISKAHVDYLFEEQPRTPRKVIEELREGILVGSSCGSGELFKSLLKYGYEKTKEKAKFYDYIEVMPLLAYRPLLVSGEVNSIEEIQDVVTKLVQMGEELGIPVVATGDVHYIEPYEQIFRKVIASSIRGKGLREAKQQAEAEVYFRTTEEMLEEFAFLGEEKAREIVVNNTQAIAKRCDEIVPVRDKLYTPSMPGADDDIRKLSYDKAHEIYGNSLPEIVEARLEKELNSIITNGFSVIYLIAQKLVHKSLQDGYLVGSRGSVGSSFVATMTGITEVNPLCPHYVCPKCKHSEFYNHGEFGSGYDMPDKECPDCGTLMKHDGQDIPFETFLGFNGDKVPDIDLNFSGEYQPHAHNYTKVLFGEDHVYRAGTIGATQEKTGIANAISYCEEQEMHVPKAEILRLAEGVTGVKRTTGQHPGGIIVIPENMDVYDFTPIQYPANDATAEWRTTHFDFHAIHDNVLKLDILGHDDPTMIRMLQDLSGINPMTIPSDDPAVLSLFSSTEALGVTPEQILSDIGTYGVPEFGTHFVRNMLKQTKPTTFAELLQISGLSHGTDVWNNNAESLIQSGTAVLSECIGCRDDIMVYLIHHGLEDGLSFKIMESVRKGKGITPEDQEKMREADVPEWYIDSCLKIKYMFPKAHAAAYVLMALRVAYFKVHFPILYYCAYFSIRAKRFDLELFLRDKSVVVEKIKEIRKKGPQEITAIEKELLPVMEIANEMLQRGYHFANVDLYRSEAQNFVIDGDTLICPFNVIPSLGDTVAEKIMSEREKSPFISKEDLMNRTGISKTVVEYMTQTHILDDLQDENQCSLFDF